MRFNKVQLAWHGNKSAIDAVDRGGGEVFAQCIDKDGNPGYWSLIIVHKDSPIMSLEQLLANGKSLTFSNGDPQSTSGFLVPGYYAFGVNGVDPAKHFKVVRTGNHESNALAVANKQVDAATFNTEAMFKLENSRPADAQKLRPIWKSPLIASDPMVYRSDMEPGVKTRVREFFLTYGKTEEQRAKLAPLKWSGFKASDNNQLLPYRQLNFIREKAKLMADDKLDATAKAARIAELDAKVKEIDAQIAKLPKAEEAAAPAK
jgi:phosphonate transport system substrate-binding protein